MLHSRTFAASALRLPSPPHTRYDEPQMLKDIERRLGQTIVHLAPDMKLTGGLEKLVFGAHKDSSSAPANSEHFRRLRPVMEELVHLETSAQVTSSCPIFANRLFGLRGCSIVSGT
jgi:hypothetical protein